MSQNDIVKKNLELHALWMNYVFDHPEILDKVPPNAHLVIVPNNDAKLANENTKTIRHLHSEGYLVVVVHMDVPKLPVPKIELVEAHS